MSWSGLASNQMVTFTNAQSGGFTLNAGQSNVTSNQCMTKSDALTKYNLSSSAMSSYASNQLVPKSTWVSGVTYYLAGTNATDSTTSTGICSITMTSGNIYTTNSSGILSVGDLYYGYDGVSYFQVISDFPYLTYMEGSSRVWIEVNTTTGAILSKTNCSSTSYDYYNATEYTCNPSGTGCITGSSILVAVPSGSFVSTSFFYASYSTSNAYKITSSASSQIVALIASTALILNLSNSSTTCSVIACTILID